MFGLVVIVALVAAVVVGTVLGHRYRVGPPVLLILSGSLLGLIPRFGDVQIDGEVVLLLFLPAILYWESMNTSFREIRWNLRVIVMFSIGLVIATAVAVSWTARALGMESHAAAVLGAVLSPTDAAAVAGLAKRLPRRALTVLRGESLINDGTRSCCSPSPWRSRKVPLGSARPRWSAGSSSPISAESWPGCWSAAW